MTKVLPGQCSHNLGEYPCRKVWDPDGWDEHELDRLKEEGMRLIQVQEEWSDGEPLSGRDKLSPLNPAGFRRFVEMVHTRGMKLLVYAEVKRRGGIVKVHYGAGDHPRVKSKVYDY